MTTVDRDKEGLLNRGRKPVEHGFAHKVVLCRTFIGY